jgi:hypothetical protein
LNLVQLIPFFPSLSIGLDGGDVPGQQASDAIYGMIGERHLRQYPPSFW